MFNEWKSRISGALIMLGAISLVLSIIFANFFANKTVYESEVSSPSFAPITISKPTVLNAVSNEIKITAVGQGKEKVQLAIGRSKDVKDYAEYDKTAYAEIDRFKGYSLDYVLYNIDYKPKKPINLESDMWFFYASGTGKTYITWNKNKADDYSIIALTDGKKPAPKLYFEWTVEPYSPYTKPFLIIGIMLLVIGLAGMLFTQFKELFVSTIVNPILERIKFNKAVTQADSLKVSEIEKFAANKETNLGVTQSEQTQPTLSEEVKPQKRYPSRRELREQEKRRK